MRPRVSIITLGVDDLDRALTFYRDGLVLRTRGIVGTEYPHGAVIFFDLMNGQKLAVWSRKDMAHEVKLPEARAARPNSRSDTLCAAKLRSMRSSSKRGEPDPS